MVRLPVPRTVNSNSKLLSKKNHCLSLLKLSSSVKHVSQIHAQILVSGLQQDTNLLTELIRFCSLSPSKHLSYAHSLLYNSLDSLPPSWNFLIRGYASGDAPKNAIRVFHRMRKEGVGPNNFTFPFVLKACATCLALEEGKQVHADIFKFGLDCDVYVNNNLVHLYGSCKRVWDACKVFDEMPVRSIVSWNSVITACVQNLWLGDAIWNFVKMKDFGFEPNETTMVIMLSLCAQIGNLSLGRWIHSQVIERGMILNCQLGTAIVDMYAKSGDLGYAKLVFDRMEKKNVWTWSAMILGLAQHGFGKEGLELFLKMKESVSICPNYVTFLGVLCACSHAGLVDEGFRYFYEMEHRHGIRPMVIHYGAMVDILGRAGNLEEAYNFLMDVPFQPDPILWRTLLSACSIHNANVSDGLVDKVRKKLLELEPRRSENFVIIANMYADAGMWETATNVRRTMRDGGLKKIGGESCIVLEGSIRQFFSGCSKDDHGSIELLLDGLNLNMKMVNSL